MSNSMLFYKNVAPLNKQRHADWSVKGTDSFGFSKMINSVPLTAVEFPLASREFSIVFAKSKDGIMPIAVLGVRNGENVFVDDSGVWQASYIPAFIRRYPFIFSTTDNGETLTLCLDEDYSGCGENADGGERLFTEAGENTEYLEKVVAFLKEYQTHLDRTRNFCDRLDKLGILEPMGAQFKTPDGQDGTLSGFLVVSREKLKALEPEKVAELVKTDELEMIYLHLNSMQNIKEAVKRTAAQKLSA